ncbi:MAG: J domain-containing protein [Oscillospiraceae bacterium]
MTDPYKVLGVSPEDSDDKIKSAYRELARKYHPDSYANNPLADLASEKMKEINEAYDTVVAERKNGTTRNNGSYQSNNSYYGGSQNSYGSQSSSQFSDIRRLINQNRITEAEELLDGVPQDTRDAEWYFLKGNIFHTRGWTTEAYNYFTIATQKNPSNNEYRAALNQLEWQRKTGSPFSNSGYNTQQVGGCSGCDMCSSLICADCCCECMGGDLIRCC